MVEPVNWHYWFALVTNRHPSPQWSFAQKSYLFMNTHHPTPFDSVNGGSMYLRNFGINANIHTVQTLKSGLNT